MESSVDKTVSSKEKIFIITLFVMLCFMVFRPTLDNDTYWLLNTGKYIIENGIPETEPFTIHEGLKFLPQQWLTTVIFYSVYDNFGEIGLYVLAFIVYMLIVAVMYKTSLLISEKNMTVSAKLILFACLPLSLFVVLRPQLISMLIFVLEIYCLENYISSRKKIYLLLMPVLSIALINLHAAFWIFFFILMVPYFLDGLKFKKSLIECQGYGIKWLVPTFALCFALGTINPFGFKSMTYIFNSYGYSNINFYIQEMRSPDFKDYFGIFLFLVYLTVVMLYLIKKDVSTRLRYVLITLGTAYMGLASIRSFMIFVVCSIPLLAYKLKSSKGSNIKFGEERFFKQKIILLILILLLGNYVKYSRIDFDMEKNFAPVKAAEFINKKIDNSNMRLFNGYGEGAYLEFVGIKTFIDPRAEVFLKDNNGKADILNDYFDTIAGKMHYQKLAEKYELTHFLVEKGGLLNTYLMNDENYRRIYKDSRYEIFENKKLR